MTDEERARILRSNAWGRHPVETASASPAPAAVTGSQQPPAPAAGSGLLGTVASAAVGVVAGSMLAQGIGSLLGHHNVPDHAATPPGGGTLVDTDYGNNTAGGDDGYVAEDFDDGGDSGDIG